MRTRLVKLWKEQRGSALVFVSLSFVVLLGFVGFVIDGGTLYYTKSYMQKAANAAVLSGAQELTYQQNAVEDVVYNILEKHGQRNSLDQIEVVMKDKVTIHLSEEVPLSFGKLFGQQTATVKVKAAAALFTMGKAEGVAPLGIDDSIPLIYGQEYNLKVDNDLSDTGFFGILALGGTGAKTYEDNLKNGYGFPIEIGDIIDTQTGNVAGKTKTGVNDRINRCPYPEGEIQHRDCARIILVPVYTPYNQTSNQLKQIQVTGFAYFYIIRFEDSHQKSIRGMFIERAGTGTATPEAPNKGAYTIRLIE
jgi:hypothetical protein